MRDSSRGPFFPKKAFEISYALLRVAAYAKRQLAEYLEKHAFALLDAAVGGEWGSVRRELRAVLYFLHLGAETNLLNPQNAEMIRKEASGLQTAIHTAITEGEEEAQLPFVHLEGIFSTSEKKVKRQVDAGKKEEGGLGDVATEEKSSKSASIRQTAILERVHHVGNCRLRDLLEHFRGTSERTLRYDLEELVGKGALERVGGGGPHAYYRIAGLPYKEPEERENPLVKPDEEHAVVA